MACRDVGSNDSRLWERVVACRSEGIGVTRGEMKDQGERSNKGRGNDKGRGSTEREREQWEIIKASESKHGKRDEAPTGHK